MPDRMLSRIYGSSSWWVYNENKCDNHCCCCGSWVSILSLQVNFEDEARIKFLKLLGFSKDDIEKKVFQT